MLLRLLGGFTALLRVLPVHPILQACAQDDPGLHPSPTAGITLGKKTKQMMLLGCAAPGKMASCSEARCLKCANTSLKGAVTGAMAACKGAEFLGEQGQELVICAQSIRGGC